VIGAKMDDAPSRLLNGGAWKSNRKANQKRDRLVNRTLAALASNQGRFLHVVSNLLSIKRLCGGDVLLRVTRILPLGRAQQRVCTSMQKSPFAATPRRDFLLAFPV
jgi:hypothetical protein